MHEVSWVFLPITEGERGSSKSSTLQRAGAFSPFAKTMIRNSGSVIANNTPRDHGLGQTRYQVVYPMVSDLCCRESAVLHLRPSASKLAGRGSHVDSPPRSRMASKTPDRWTRSSIIARLVSCRYSYPISASLGYHHCRFYRPASNFLVNTLLLAVPFVSLPDLFLDLDRKRPQPTKIDAGRR